MELVLTEVLMSFETLLGLLLHQWHKTERSLYTYGYRADSNFVACKLIKL